MAKKKMNIEELKSLIANSIREENLHEALPEDAVEKIKNKILSKKRKDSAKEDIPDVVSELDIASFPQGSDEDDRKFPDESQVQPSPEQQVDMHGDKPEVDVEAGSTPTEQPSDPKMGYTPELPEMLKKAEPAEVFVFRHNDINENGENLSFKPFRLMDDPDVKKSMKELWVEQGKTKAEVYAAKFEKIGEIEFNYADGTSKFVNKPSEPDYQGDQGYKENPYEAPSTPQIDGQTQEELETYIKSSVDLEKVAHDIVMNIVKDALLTNSEKAINDNNEIQVSEDISTPIERDGYGSRTDQMVKPMEESVEKGDEEIEFNITMQEIVEGDYKKIILPDELNETINSGDKSMLVNENEHVQEWVFEDKKYYIPVGRISKNKGYIKS